MLHRRDHLLHWLRRLIVSLHIRQVRVRWIRVSHIFTRPFVQIGETGPATCTALVGCSPVFPCLYYPSFASFLRGERVCLCVLVCSFVRKKSRGFIPGPVVLV